jgi:hypothetical protein
MMPHSMLCEEHVQVVLPAGLRLIVNVVRGCQDPVEHPLVKGLLMHKYYTLLSLECGWYDTYM